jgi:hypothetical protein
VERGGKRKMRITKENLKIQEERINYYLKNVKVKVAFRYNYVAIDLQKDNAIIDTLITGLSKPMCSEILEAIERLLKYEKT